LQKNEATIVGHTCSLIFRFWSDTIFLYFYSFEHKKASPQNIVSSHTSSTPHMVNFLESLKEIQPMAFFQCPVILEYGMDIAD